MPKLKTEREVKRVSKGKHKSLGEQEKKWGQA